MSQWNSYGPTAARARGRPGRESRPKSVTIDLHSHVGVPRASEFVRPHLSADASPLVRFANAETRALNQKQEADIIARASLEQRLADLDAMGLDMQVIKPPPPQCYYALPIDIAVAAAQIVNDGIAEYVAGKPDPSPLLAETSESAGTGSPVALVTVATFWTSLPSPV